MSVATVGNWQEHRRVFSESNRDSSFVYSPRIYIIDDDPRLGQNLTIVGRRMDWEVFQFSSADEFIGHYDRSRPGCLLLDMRMPPSMGLDVQQSLTARGVDVPTIVLSSYASVKMAVEVMSRGALTLLEKPFHLDELVAYIRRGFRMDTAKRATRSKQAQAEAQLARLTVKEREVLDLVTSGKTNKQIAALLHISIRAVEDRRARLMKRLGARSLAELVQIRIAVQS